MQLDITSQRIGKSHFIAACNASHDVRAMVHQANEHKSKWRSSLQPAHALHTADARFARWLLVAADYARGPELHINQEFAAEMMGVRRTTVSGVATHMQEKGIIEYRRGRITVLDRPGLVRQSCECYWAVKDDPEIKPLASAPGSA